MNETSIESDNITLAYGKHPVLRGVSLQVQPGSIYGFLGRNGAGKSSFIRLLAGLGRPDSGELRIFGCDPLTESSRTLPRVGYMADHQILPSYMKAADLFAWMRPLYPDWDDEVVRRLAGKFGVDQHKRIHKLSLGQQRHLAFIAAMARKPDLLILDEPAANLDVAVRRAFLDEMLELLRDEGKTVFFSTHILGDVERVADHIGILSGGRMCVSEALDDFKENIREIRFFWDRKDPPPVAAAEALSFQKGQGEALLTLRLNRGSNPAALARAAGCQWEERALNLEDLFINLTRNEGELS